MQIVRVLGVLAATALAAPVWAQAPGRPPQGQGQGQGRRMRSAKMRLPRVIESAARLSGVDALTKPQAKRMAALIAPWRKRPTMSEDAARTLLTGLSGVLTPAQKTALQNDRPRFGGGDGPRGGGRDGGPGGGGRDGGGRGFGGRGGGPGGSGGQRPMGGQMDKMRAMMASFNPFYTGTPAGMSAAPAQIQEMMQNQRDRLNRSLSQLQSRAR